jgi:hypothetical protein
MEMIKIRIPVSEFTITADNESVIVMFPKPQIQQDTSPTIKLFQSDVPQFSKESVLPADYKLMKAEKDAEESVQKEDWYDKKLPEDTEKKKNSSGRKRADGRYPLSSEMRDAVRQYQKLTGISVAKVAALVAAKTGVHQKTVLSYMYTSIATTEDVAKEYGNAIGKKVKLEQSIIDGKTVWGIDSTDEPLKSGNETPIAENEAPVKDESLSDAEIKKRIAEKTKHKSLSDRGFLSLGLISLLRDYLADKKISEDLICHELAVRTESSKNALKLMINGETEAFVKLIPHLKELLKVDIVRIENGDGTAYWEGV